MEAVYALCARSETGTVRPAKGSPTWNARGKGCFLSDVDLSLANNICTLPKCLESFIASESAEEASLRRCVWCVMVRMAESIHPPSSAAMTRSDALLECFTTGSTGVEVTYKRGNSYASIHEKRCALLTYLIRFLTGQINYCWYVLAFRDGVSHRRARRDRW
jgi:hypothetical protein